MLFGYFRRLSVLCSDFVVYGEKLEGFKVRDRYSIMQLQTKQVVSVIKRLKVVDFSGTIKILVNIVTKKH